MADTAYALPAIACLGLLYQWAHHHAAAHAREVRERRERCPHRPEAQRTIRVNNIMTANPVMIHAVLPGRRWLAKQCDDCGLQTLRYRPHMQPWDEYVAEYKQETIDRAAEYAAREARHKADAAYAEAERMRRRAAGK